MNIYGFEKGKETEKAIKRFLGLADTVSGKGEIDAIYKGTTIEIKRNACALYVGKRFNRYRNAHNAIAALIEEAYFNKGNAFTRSEKVAYSVDGTIEHTYMFSTALFLYLIQDTKAAKIHWYKANNKMLRIVPNKNFCQAIAEYGMTLEAWKNMIDHIE